MVKYEGAMTWSRINDGEQCGLLFMLRHIEKRKEPSSPHFVKGTRVHTGVDDFLRKRKPALPAEADPMREYLEKLKNNPTLRGEEAWGYDDEWQPLPVTGYFSKQDRLRAKVDALMWLSDKEIEIIDFKTGQVRDSGLDQPRFYAMLALLRFPKAMAAYFSLWFLEHNTILPEKKDRAPLLRTGLDKTIKEFSGRIKAVINKTGKAEPGVYCKWCPFAKSKGGPCQY